MRKGIHQVTGMRLTFEAGWAIFLTSLGAFLRTSEWLQVGPFLSIQAFDAGWAIFGLPWRI